MHSIKILLTSIVIMFMMLKTTNVNADGNAYMDVTFFPSHSSKDSFCLISDCQEVFVVEGSSFILSGVVVIQKDPLIIVNHRRTTPSQGYSHHIKYVSTAKKLLDFCHLENIRCTQIINKTASGFEFSYYDYRVPCSHKNNEGGCPNPNPPVITPGSDGDW